MKLVVMGVSGCGKSSVGEALAERLKASFVDGDDLHPESNRRKMSSGIPLTDEDRWPWLEAVGSALKQNENVIVACSALKRTYRQKIREIEPEVRFIHLHGTRELLQERINARSNHFMPASLLESQLATLEPIGKEENGHTFDIARSVPQIVEDVVTWLQLK